MLRKISSLCGEYLISGISPEFLGLLLLLAAGAGIRNDIQQRARLAEIFYPFVMAGFVLMLILAAFHMRAESFADAAAFSLTEVAREGWRTLERGRFWRCFRFFLDRWSRRKIEKALLEGLGKVWLFLTAAAVILIGTFGLEGVRRMEVPVIQLMAGTRLPGKFLERFDIVWLALLLCSILFALGSLLFYGTHLTGMRGDKDGSSGCDGSFDLWRQCAGTGGKRNGTVVSSDGGAVLSSVFSDPDTGSADIFPKNRKETEVNG